MSPNAARRSPVQLAAGLVFLLVGALAVAYALFAIEHAAALVQKRTELSAHVSGWLTSENFFFGGSSLRYMVPWYEQASVRMVLHMSFGGIALGLGALQFVPALRRKFPRFHRASGLLVWIAVLVSVIFAVAFLLFVPMQQGASGPAFHLSLWALSLLTLALLWQAVLAVARRDFRSHMVWMALVFAALATAPALRVDWILFSDVWGAAGQEAINLAAGSFVLVQTIFGMALWLSLIGDADLPARAPAASGWPRWALVALSAATAAAAVHEGLLAPAGADLFHGLRDARDMLPRGAGALWALATVAVMLLLPSAWQRAHAGAKPSALLALAVAGVGAGAILIGLGYAQDSLARFSTRAFWLGYGVCVLASLVLAHVIKPNSLGRNAWSVNMLASLWLPSQMGGAILLALMLGTTFTEAMLAALVTGAGTVWVIGTASGFGARIGGLARVSAPGRAGSPAF